MMEQDNRKSHLAPQPSPTQDFLRSKDSSPNQPEDRNAQTPTSGEIPIAGTGYVSSRDPYPSVPSRSPTRNSATAPRPPPPPHPGMVRGNTTNSIPKVAGHGENGAAGGPSPVTFSLPVRPPPSGPLPPPPPRKSTPDSVRRDPRDARESRRQPSYGLPPNSAYNM